VISGEAEQASAWWDLAARLRIRREAGETGLDSHIAAFDYLLTERGTETRERAGVFAPKGEFENGSTYPPQVATAPEEMAQAWLEAAQSVPVPLARSRYADLLWQRKAEPAHAYARTAIDDYLTLASAEGQLRITTSAAAAMRAVELAVALGDQALQQRVGAELAEAARGSLARSEPEPGLTYRLIAAGTQLPRSAQHQDLDSLLEQLHRRYADHPRILDDVADVRAHRAPDEDARKSVRRQQSRDWERLADRSTGLVRLFNLRRALEVAELYGLADEARDLSRRVQEISPDDLDLRVLETEIEVEAAPIQRALDGIIGDDDFFSALRRMVEGFGPPSGTVDRNIDLVELQMRESPLAFMFPTVIRGPENTTLADLRDDKDHREAGLRRQEGLSIAWFAIHVADVIERALAKYGLPPRSDLVVFFTSSYIEPAVADRVAHALELFVAGDYDAAAHVLAPRLERAIRLMARKAGLVVTNEPRGQKAGGIRPLGDLLSQLAGHLNESWRRYFFNLLADPLGHNLRNQIGHGLLDEARRVDAAMLIHAAVVLVLLEPTEQRTDKADAHNRTGPAQSQASS
jgi:hypothetical protein